MLLAGQASAVTRFYLPSSGSPAVTPSSWSDTDDGGGNGWDKTTSVVGPFKMVTTPIGSALTDKTTTAIGDSAVNFIAAMRFVSAPLDAQTIDGTLSGVIRCMENNSGLNGHIAIAVKVIKPDGTDRGVLLACSAPNVNNAVPSEIITATADTRRCMTIAESATLTLTSTAVTAGDYLVVELGYRENVNVSSSRSATIRYGDAGASDFAHSDSLTTDLNPWVEFSDTITFQVGGSPVSKIIQLSQ